jgi:hypothetical protein
MPTVEARRVAISMVCMRGVGGESDGVWRRQAGSTYYAEAFAIPDVPGPRQRALERGPEERNDAPDADYDLDHDGQPPILRNRCEIADEQG